MDMLIACTVLFIALLTMGSLIVSFAYAMLHKPRVNTGKAIVRIGLDQTMFEKLNR